MSGTTCSSCQYFKQHYVLDHRKLVRIFCGHCIFSKVKSKRPDAKSCGSYMPAEPEENAFVSKEYLNKRLLEYLLSLDFLPAIHDEREQKE